MKNLRWMISIYRCRYYALHHILNKINCRYLNFRSISSQDYPVFTECTRYFETTFNWLHTVGLGLHYIWLITNDCYDTLVVGQSLVIITVRSDRAHCSVLVMSTSLRNPASRTFSSAQRVYPFPSARWLHIDSRQFGCI